MHRLKPIIIYTVLGFVGLVLIISSTLAVGQDSVSEPEVPKDQVPLQTSQSKPQSSSNSELSSSGRTREQEGQAVKLVPPLISLMSFVSTGIALYNRALRLLNHVQSHSNLVPPRTSLHPPISILSPSSYAPLLEDVTWLNRGVFSFLLKILKKFNDSPNDDDPNSINRRDPKKPALLLVLGFPKRVFDRFGRTSTRITKNGMKSSSAKILDQKEAEEATHRAIEHLNKSAFEYGNLDAGMTLGNIWLWGGNPPNVIQRDPRKAMEAFEWVATLSGNATAQANLAFLYATGYGGALGQNLTHVGDQSKALLYYTFSALGGDYAAEMSLGYRHWVGIGTPQSCREALPFYKSAAEKSMRTFNAGPPGGRHMPPTKVRLSDRDGGVYGPGASVVSSGNNKDKHSPQQPSTLQAWNDVLEFYQFHAERGDATFMFRLGRIYYYGFGSAGDSIQDFALTNGRHYLKAFKWFNRIVRAVWPRDPEAATSPNGHAYQNKQGQWQTPTVGAYDAAKDPKQTVDETHLVAAGLSAGYLGRIYLRGEGVPRNNAKAFLWFSRGATQGDRESQNGLGIMYRDGLGVRRNLEKALEYFQLASDAELADANVNLGKYYMGVDPLNAVPYFDNAIKNGDTYQSYYYLAEINALNAGQTNKPEFCPIAVAFYKRVAERGDWFQEVFWKAEKAWADGDEVTALLGFLMMAERGYEVAQNNVAYILDRHKKRLRLPKERTAGNATDRLALTYWTRSAAQDNIDALVKMGDYYLDGFGTSSGLPQPEKAAACYQTATNTHLSAMAMWNLGWMHENGAGVTQDYHLAKRFYDLALETNSEASLPVTLALMKLYIRSVWDYVIHGDSKYLLVFTSASDEPSGSGWWSLRRLRDELTRRWLGISPPPGADPTEERGEVNVPADGEEAGFDAAATQKALEQNEDPVEWARNARERDRMLGEGEEEDDMFLAGNTGDDFLETAGILFLCLGLGAFVFFRQQREQANLRAEAEQAQVELDDVLDEELIQPREAGPPANEDPNDATPPAEDLANVAAQIPTTEIADRVNNLDTPNQRQGGGQETENDQVEGGLRRRIGTDQEEADN
ncbi:hypothetical protein H4Q26_007283 [Puccinia striiformis f. sp. tritici PST-130]|nr:hypothetical protein H4Q26_007283 [Puccinia striiformis f. sp. tritici PST-130]